MTIELSAEEIAIIEMWYSAAACESRSGASSARHDDGEREASRALLAKLNILLAHLDTVGE